MYLHSSPHVTSWEIHGLHMFFHNEGEILAQISQRSCGCPLPGGVQGQVGWGFGQPGLVEDVPAHGRGVGTRCSIRILPTQIILSSNDSVICM